MTEKWEALYEANRGRVLAYLTARTGSRETAEDLCMDVFEQAYRSFLRFDETKSSINPWLFTITRYTLTDYFRTHRNTVPLEKAEHLLSAPDEAETRLIREETISQLASALRELEREERVIVVLRYERGWTLTEISERIGVSYGMVKVKHRTALNKLRQTLGE